MQFKNEMIYERERLEKSIEEKTLLLSNLPNKKLDCCKNGEYFRWRVWENGQRQYLSKKEEPLAKQLALKGLLELEVNESKRELRAIDMYLRNCSKTDSISKYANKNDEYRRLLSDYLDRFDEQSRTWLADVYKGEIPYPAGRRYRTLKGDLVRSKSEMIIEDKLFTKGIPFKYEEPIDVSAAYAILRERGVPYNGKRWDVFFPDFTVYLPKANRTILWEHFGKMGDLEYAKKTSDKLLIYSTLGYLIGRDLVVTFENEDSGIDNIWFEKLIDKHFVEKDQLS